MAKGKQRKTPEQKATEAQLPPDQSKELSPEQQLNDYIKDHVVGCIKIGDEYRQRFRKVWDELEKQVRQIPPGEWDQKEDWQSKVYIGQQAKTSEAAYANLNAMVFPSEKFFNMSATKNKNRDEEAALEDLIAAILGRGDFYYHKDFTLEEAVDHGTSFMKMIANADKSGLKFTWRSCYDVLIDPHCRNDWNKARYIVDQYQKDASFLIEEMRKGKASLYDQQQLDAAVQYLNSQASTGRQEEIERIKNIDGTGYLAFPKNYKTLLLNEYWGQIPIPNDLNDFSKGVTVKNYVVAMINQDFIIRCEEQPYGFLPFVPARLKHRKYDFYGKGYLLNGLGTQDLMNSMINLGFDSAKICAMDIVLLDSERVADQSTIQYKPLAVWRLKGSPQDAVKFTRQAAASSLNEILTGIGILDQIHQDVTGVTRHSEGSQALDTKGTDQTLGEYKMKAAAVDKRFLSVAKRFEDDFVKTLLRNIYKVITNPQLFTQEAANELIGFKPICVQDPASGVTITVGQQPRLDIKKLGKKDEMDWDFRASGVMQFSQRQELMQKLQQALTAALQNPTLTALTNIDVLWRRIFQVSDIPDWEEVIKTKDQVEKLKQALQQKQQMAQAPMPGAMPPGGGMPQRPQLPQPRPPMGMPMPPPGQPQMNGAPL